MKRTVPDIVPMRNIEQIGKSCTGCRACEQVCPKSCITMQPNEEGFLYPSVDGDKCIHCGLCLKKCAQSEKVESKEAPTEFYAFVGKDKDELLRSASGGASDVAAKVILRNGGVVFGSTYTDDLEVKHIKISDDVDRPKLQSSKYVQSDTGDCYFQAKECLETGRNVLFTGTPCQIDGLYHYLGRDYENLYTIDIICHGVPSPLFFKKYVEYMGSEMGGKLIEYNFRSKDKRGWGTQYLAKTKTKTKTKTLSLDKYGKHFMSGDCYRECCYQCQYADVHKRPGDLTIGDFWGVDKTHPELSSPLGVSSVIVNSEKGKQLIEMMRPDAELVPITLDEVLEKQGNLVHPTVRPKTRDMFYEGILEGDFVDKLEVGLQMKERFKSALPTNTVRFLKQRLGGVNDKVSVIIPIYNVAPFLENCIESVCEQNYRNLEIILVDDGSKDESGAICDSYAARDERISVIHKQNGGVSAARNTGIDAATGEWICFVDGDDYIMPDYVGYMLAMAREYDSQVAITLSMFGNFDESQATEDDIKVWTSEDAVEAILCYRVPIGCYCKLFNREFLNEIRFIPELFIGEGFNFNVDAFQHANKVVAGNLKTYYYRRDNPTSAMTVFSKEKCECGLNAIQVINERLQIHSERIDLAWRYANWRTHSDFYDMCVLAHAEKTYPELYQRCVKVTKEQALIAFNVPTSRQNKIRAVVMRVCPRMIPFAMQLRKKRFHVSAT